MLFVYYLVIVILFPQHFSTIYLIIDIAKFKGIHNVATALIT
jgi:hypothetical protein